MHLGIVLRQGPINIKATLAVNRDGTRQAVGASANIVVLGIAQRAGHPVSFWGFTRRGAIVVAVSLTISVGYLWVRYFALS